MTARDQIATFAECVFEPTDTVESRFLPKGRSIWVPAGELADQADELLRDNAAGEHIYVGANPRKAVGGRKAEDVAVARCLFCDWDGITVEEARERITKVGLPKPTMLIASGHGVHGYWRLIEPLTDLQAWTGWQRRLIAVVDSDPSIHDAPRVMRLPGFTNWKSPAAECSIIKADPDWRFALEELVRALPPVTSSTKAARKTSTPPALVGGVQGGPDIVRRALAWLAKRDPAIEGQGGDLFTFTTAATLRRDYGLSEEQTFELMMGEWNGRCQPPWDKEELRTKIANAGRYGTHALGVKAAVPPPPRARHRGNGQAPPPPPSVEAEQPSRTPDLQVLEEVEAELVQWLWWGRIPLRKLTLLAGDPGLGKSCITTDMAARVSRGTPWPDNVNVPTIAGGVVLLSAEDDLADTIKPRLSAAGADCRRIVALQGVKRFDAETGEEIRDPFSLQYDLKCLEMAVEQCRGCRLVIIDPVTAYLGIKLDSHRNTEVRAVLGPLSDLAGRLGVAVVAVTHLNKSVGGAAMYRAMGSLAFIAAARAAWAVTKDKDDPARRLMLPVKNNLAADGTGLAYRLADGGNDAPVVAWEPDPIAIDVDDALGPDRSDDHRTERNDAIGWLREALGDGSLPTKSVQRLARESGHAWATVRRAADELQIKPKRDGFGEGSAWYWALPFEDAHDDDAKALAPPTHPEVSIFDGGEHLRPDDPKNGGSDPPDSAPSLEDAHRGEVGTFTGFRPPDRDENGETAVERAERYRREAQGDEA